MNLKEFLATANADDEIALADWRAIPTTETAYMATSTMNAFLAEKKLKIPFKKAAADDTHEFQNYADVFVDSTMQRTDFNFNPKSTMGASVVGMLNIMSTGPFMVNGIDYSSTIGDLRDLLVTLGSKITYKNTGTTIEQVKAIRYPAVTTSCEHGGQNFVVSISGKDLFSFVTTTNNHVSNLQVTMYWREDGSGIWKKFQNPFLLLGGNGVLSQVIRRPSGINAARHFKFEYTAPYAELISGIAVSVGQ